MSAHSREITQFFWMKKLQKIDVFLMGKMKAQLNFIQMS